MKITRFLKTMWVGVVVAAVMVGGSSLAETASHEAIYTADQSNIIVQAGEPTFTIKLKSNPSTGYAWFLRDYNDRLISPVAWHYASAKTNLMGASGYELWTFRLNPSAFVVPQQMTMRFIYRRSWESRDHAAAEATFNVSTSAEHAQ